MMRTAALCVLLVTALAGNAGADEAAFRSRNDGRWTLLKFDAQGKLQHARTDDPAIVGTSATWDDEDIIRLRGILQIHRDDLGGTADEREPIRASNGRLGFLLFDESTTLITGFAELRRTGKTLDVIVAHPAIDADAAAKQLVGKRFQQTIKIGRGPQRDCAMADGGARNCRSKIVRILHRTVVLTGEDVGAALALRVVGGSVRLTACIAAEHPVPDNVAESGLDVLSNELAGVPRLVDAVTRKQLPMHSARCEQ